MEDKSIFVEYFGDTPIVRILDFLIVGQDFDYSMTDIAEGSNVGWTSFKRVWNILEKNKVVKYTRAIGKARLYKMNKEDPTVKRLIKLYWEITKSETDKLFKEQGWLQSKEIEVEV